MGKDPFDFTDVSDLPDDLQKRLHSDSNEQAQAYADVIRKGAEAGHDELNINQIIAAATRMGMDVPTQQTVRNYLNKAVELGMVAKATRLTYSIGKNQAPVGAAKKKGAKSEEVNTSEDAVVTKEIDTDPLADL